MILQLRFPHMFLQAGLLQCFRGHGNGTKLFRGWAEPGDPLRKPNRNHREASVARTLFSAGREGGRKQGWREGGKEILSQRQLGNKIQHTSSLEQPWTRIGPDVSSQGSSLCSCHSTRFQYSYFIPTGSMGSVLLRS